MQQSQKCSQLDSMQRQHTLPIQNPLQLVWREKTEHSKVIPLFLSCSSQECCILLFGWDLSNPCWLFLFPKILKE